MTDSLTPTVEQKKSRRGLLALVGAGGAAAVAALLGRSNGAAAADFNWTGSDPDATGRFENTGAGAGVKGYAANNVGVFGTSTNYSGVYGLNASGFSSGVKGVGKPGVYGIVRISNGSGVKGEGDAPGSIGVFAKNTPDRRALRTKGRVQMDTARKVTLSNRSNLVNLPTGVQAGAFAIVLAMVQGASGNGAFVRRAWRVDDKHIRITFDKTPANPTAVGYWVVQTG